MHIILLDLCKIYDTMYVGCMWDVVMQTLAHNIIVHTVGMLIE